MAFIDEKDKFWENDILEEYFKRRDPEARRLAEKEIAPDPSDDYRYGMGDYAPIPAPPRAPSRPLPRRVVPPISFQPGGGHVPAPPPVIPVDPAIGMNANMEQMAPDFNVPEIPNRPGTPTIVRSIPTGPEHPTMEEVAPEIRTDVHDPSTYEHDVPMEVVEYNPAAGRAPGMSDQEIAIRKAEEEVSPPRRSAEVPQGRGTNYLPEGTIVQETEESNAPTFEYSGGMFPTPIPPGGLGRGTSTSGGRASKVEVGTEYPGMFPVAQTDFSDDVMEFRPEPSRDMHPETAEYLGYSHEEIVGSGEGPSWKEGGSLSDDQRTIYNHHKDTLGPVMANNVAAHYGKLVRDANKNYVKGDTHGEGNSKKTYMGGGRWVDKNKRPTAPPIPEAKDLSIRKKDELHQTAIFNANRSQAEAIAQQERIKNAPIHTPEELAYLRGEVDYGKGGPFGAGAGLTNHTRNLLRKQIGPNNYSRVLKEHLKFDQQEGTGIYRGSEPMRSVGPDGTVTNYDRTVKNRDGSETVTVTKRGRTMQYTVAPNGQIVDGSVRYLSGDELSRNAAGAQREYYESDVRDPRWRARNDPQLRRRYGSPEDIDRAVERSLPKRV